MPITYPAIVFGNFPLLEGGPDPEKTTAAYQKFYSFLWCDEIPSLVGVSHDHIPCEIHYYVPPEGSPPVVNSMCRCSGEFSILRDDETGFPTMKIKIYTIQAYPGDPEDPGYESSCPTSTHQQVALAGTVGCHVHRAASTDDDLRGFHLHTSVYAGPQQTTDFTVVCLFRATRRWENVVLPRQGGSVHVVGEVVGSSNEGSHLVVCIQGFNYLSTMTSTNTKLASPRASQDDSGEGPSTPSKKSRWASWGADNIATPSSRGKQAQQQQGSSSQSQSSLMASPGTTGTMTADEDFQLIED